MGQQIRIDATTVIDDVAMFATDRGVTGQAGVSHSREADPAAGFPGDLAERIFGVDDAIEAVFVASNQVVARRPGGWDEDLLGKVAEVITRFFVFYGDDA